MITVKTKKLIDDAIQAEYDSSKKQHDDRYRNMNEAWGVLAEETYESKKAYKAMKNNSKRLFILTVANKPRQDMVTEIAACMLNARHLAMEACQVAAVCKKMLDGVGKC